MNTARIGENIQNYRKKIGMSQENLAGILLISRQTVSLWENGQTLPTIDNLIRLCEIFEVSLDALICGERANDGCRTDAEAPCGKTSKMMPVADCTVYASEKKRSLLTYLGILSLPLFVGLLLGVISVIYAVTEPFLSFFDGILVASLAIVGTAGAAISLIGVIFTVRALLKIKGSYTERTLCEADDSSLSVKKYAEEKLISHSVIPISKIKPCSFGTKHLVFFSRGGIIRIKKSEIENEQLLSAASGKRKGILITLIAGISALAILICTLLAVNLSGTISVAERLADIDIPKYVGKSERDVNTEAGKLTVLRETEIYFTEKYADILEVDITSDKWYNESSLPSEFSEAFASYSGFAADNYIVCDITNRKITDALGPDTEYMALCYLFDENMLRIIEFRSN